MRTKSTKDEIYIGRGAGEEILQEIKNTKNAVKIVSPYLSGSFVQELIKLNKKGKEVTLITCDNITEENSYSDFNNIDLVKVDKVHDVNFKKRRKIGISVSLFVCALALIIFLLSFIISFLFYLSLLLFSVGLVGLVSFHVSETSKISYTPLFKIKVFDSSSGDKPWSTQLIHSKVFIIDDKICFLGSANFTYSGFKTHYETVVKIQDLKAVKDISKEVDDLYNSNELRAKPVEEWVGGE